MLAVYHADALSNKQRTTFHRLPRCAALRASAHDAVMRGLHALARNVSAGGAAHGIIFGCARDGSS